MSRTIKVIDGGRLQGCLGFHVSVWLKCLQTLKEQKSGGGKGGSDVSLPVFVLPLR